MVIQQSTLQHKTMVAKNTNTSDNSIITNTSYLWDNNPKLSQLLNQIDFSPISEIDATKVFQQTSESKGEDYFTHLFSGLSPIQLEQLFQQSNHWFNEAETQFILSSWLERTSKIKKLQQQLDELSRATDKIVTNQLVTAEQEIYAIEYERALSGLKNVALLKTRKEEVGMALLELVFVYGEGEQLEKAIGILKIVTELWDSPLQNALPTTLEELRTCIQKLNQEQYDFWVKRYFPTMITVKGGIIKGRNFMGQKVSTFQLAQTPTTVWQYSIFCIAKGLDMNSAKQLWGWAGDNPRLYTQSHKYANWLNEREGFPIRYDGSLNPKAQYRLPTEIQWEYAARGGANQQSFKFSGSDNLDEVAWHSSNSKGRTQPVAQKKPVSETLPIYDMTGHVWEYIEDKFTDREKHLENKHYKNRKMRGGDFKVQKHKTRAFEVSNRVFYTWDGLNRHAHRIAKVMV